tara:strand:- start:435 stop:845 length:411 start_codon:yes stop_codon:yes gene_type:complete
VREIKDSTFVIFLIIFISLSAFIYSKTNPLIKSVSCPGTPIVQDEVNLEFDITAGNSDIVNIFVLITENGMYLGRFYIDSEIESSNLFDLPKAFETKRFGFSVERSFYPDNFEVNIDVLDENFRSSFTSCNIRFEK